MRNTAMNMIHKLAARDARVVYIGSDPGAGTLEAMRKEFPERFFIEGISEAHVIGMSAGLAMEGYIPYVNTIATFITRRCYEQVAVDLCLHNLPVRLIGNGGGLVYAPLGPTHLAIEDIAIMRALPNMTVVCDADEMKRFMEQTLDWPGPIYIRLAKGGDPVVSRAEHGFAIGKAIVMRPPGDVLMVTTGIMLQRALAAADLLAAQGINAGILHMHTVKPLDSEALLQAIRGIKLLVSLEEHVPAGSGSAVLEALVDTPRPRPAADVAPVAAGPFHAQLRLAGQPAEKTRARPGGDRRFDPTLFRGPGDGFLATPFCVTDMYDVRYSYLLEQFSDPAPILAEIGRLVATGDFTLGKPVAEFERRFAELIGTRHAIGVGSGTDALKLSLKALGVGHGDEVITAANTFIATVGAIAETGATPVFVDCDDTFCMNIDQVEAAITPRTKAIMPVHLTGDVADMPR